MPESDKLLVTAGPNGIAASAVRQGVLAKRDHNEIDESTHVPARILWPALGFPAVIAPGGGDRAIAARTICLLVLSPRDPRHFPLSKGDVARHLRIVPWKNRRDKRYYKPGGPESFAEEEIEVRSMDAFDTKDHVPQRVDDGRIELVHLGGARDLSDPAAKNSFVVGLSTWVRRFYAGELGEFPLPVSQRLPYLYEVRIAEHVMQRFLPAESGGGDTMSRVSDAAAALTTSLHHVFWVNKGRTDNATHRSEEMHLLLQYYARASRFGHDGVSPFEDLKRAGHEASARKLLSEYEFDFGKPVAPANRTEVLHPVFIRRPTAELRIGHLTDIHLDIRTNVYAHRIRNAKDQSLKLNFHDWNQACIKLYAESKQSSDVMLMTGDLIDYGRGYNGRGPLGQDKSYWRDRNWFLFHDYLAAGDNYSTPVYTSLGNHDWRFNPYPPFTWGAPKPKDFATTREALKDAHGSGYDKKSYQLALRMVGSFAAWKIEGEGGLAIEGTPLETRIESVTWYLLVMNPFLDYAWHLPGGYHLVMLDWAKDEEVDLEVILGGQSKGRNTFPNTHGGPKAMKIMTKLQKELVEHVARSASRAKILAMHAPPIGPWGHWKDDELAEGRVRYNANDLAAAADHLKVTGLWGPRVFEGTDSQRADSLYRLRGAVFDEAGLLAISKGHAFPGWAYPTLALRMSENEPLGREADYGSFSRDGRHWLIWTLSKAKFSLVLAGHIHRRNVLVIDTVGKDLPPEWRGKWVVRCIRPERAASATEKPLFVNTTSAGPLGHCEVSRGKYMVAASGYTHVSVDAGGAVTAVEFRPDVCLAPTADEPPTLALPAAAPREKAMA